MILKLNIDKKSLFFYNFRIIYQIAAFVLICSFLFCNKSTDNGKDIIAKVGSHVITVDEFKYSYEFSFSPTRSGENPRKTYLDYMIKEKLLAIEGTKKGYAKSPYVTRRVQQRRYLDVLEVYYQENVHSKVQIPEQDIQDALKKSSVKFKIRIWPTENYEKATEALAEARKVGLLQYMKNEFAKRELSLDIERNYESDWIDFLDVNPEILDGIKDLQPEDISEPLPFGNGYALFQVLDIRREGIKEDELESGVKRKRMMDRLHNIQADKIVHSLMDSVLTPMEIRVKSDVVEKMAPYLYNWINDGLPPGSLNGYLAGSITDSSKQYLKDIINILNETLVTFRGGKKTVFDYLNYMDYYRRNLKRKPSLEEFEADLITEIGRMMKNDTFVRLGEKEGFAESDSVKEDLRLWKNKWIYEAYRIDQVQPINVTDQEAKKYFQTNWNKIEIAGVDSTRFEKYKSATKLQLLHQKHIAELNNEISELYKKYPVWVDEDKLNSLDLNDAGKSKNISLFVRKRFSNQALLPTVDMSWISY